MSTVHSVLADTRQLVCWFIIAIKVSLGQCSTISQGLLMQITSEEALGSVLADTRQQASAAAADKCNTAAAPQKPPAQVAFLLKAFLVHYWQQNLSRNHAHFSVASA